MGCIVKVNQGMALLPALLQTSILALLSSSVSLRTILTSISIAVNREEILLPYPSAAAIYEATSFHILAFSSTGTLLVAESEGKFSLSTWERVYELAQLQCRGVKPASVMSDMNGAVDPTQSSDMEKILEATIQYEASMQQRWKKGLD